MESKLFTPVTFGPLTLRNRTIRSAAFESMCPGNAPSDMLLEYHRSVAAGGIGMTTVAYAAVTQSGLSFDRQLWMRPEIIPGLRRLTDAIHAEGAAAGIQLGHCGNMSHKSICGCMPVGASSGFNLYSPTFVRGLRADELPEMARAYGRSVNLAREAGCDSVEIRAAHGYLISQCLSPSTNHRKDEFGGSLQNRMRFMDMVMEEVMKAAGSDMAVLVKMNMRDGFRGGMEDLLKLSRRNLGRVGQPLGCRQLFIELLVGNSQVCPVARLPEIDRDREHFHTQLHTPLETDITRTVRYNFYHYLHTRFFEVLPCAANLPRLLHALWHRFALNDIVT